jgi:hypothetical protein
MMMIMISTTHTHTHTHASYNNAVAQDRFSTVYSTSNYYAKFQIIRRENGPRVIEQRRNRQRTAHTVNTATDIAGAAHNLDAFLTDRVSVKFVELVVRSFKCQQLLAILLGKASSLCLNILVNKANVN